MMTINLIEQYERNMDGWRLVCDLIMAASVIVLFGWRWGLP